MADIHNPGGNYFDNMRINLDAAFELELYGKPCRKRNWVFLNAMKALMDIILVRTGRMETLVITGQRRDWFVEFSAFWRNVLGGRPLNIMDFHMLRMRYRIGNQETKQLNWNTIEDHMNNWKREENISILFQQIYGNALSPYKTLSYVHRQDRVLEYGCSHAPYYRAYRKYYSHKNAKWVLADIKNISYLFSKYTYSNDRDIEEMIVIDEKNADNPLKDVKGQFDVIILTTVLEHLHKPKSIVEMLYSRLRGGGVFCL